MLMDIRGIHLNVEVQGSGQPLVLLHGLTSNLTTMQREIDYFSRSYQTVAIDSRGHGRSDKPAQYTLQDHIDDVFGVLDALHLDRIFLLGVSMGSYVAQGIASRQPQRVAKLVLITPKAQGKTSSSAAFLAAHAAELEGKSPEEIQAFLLVGIFAPTTSPEVKAALRDFGEQQAAAGLVLTPEQTLAANRALEGFDFRPVLPDITADTLVISGRHDPLNPPVAGQEIADRIPNATFVILEHSGHVPSVEEPERILALIDEFLQRK
jgi:3-oxoadipate enol-lactonase